MPCGEDLSHLSHFMKQELFCLCDSSAGITPTFLSTYLPIYLPTYLPTYRPILPERLLLLGWQQQCRQEIQCSSRAGMMGAGT